MISWKDSFEKINNELDLARKKQNALEDLHSNDRISQHTYENLNQALTTEIEQIEGRRKELAEKMTSKLNELEQQINTLETFLANVEMSYAAGEITEELHTQEASALNFGLEATKNELNFIKEAIMQLVPKETQAELTTAIESAETMEATPTETAMETVPEISTTPTETQVEETQVETPPVTDETSIEQPTEMIVEAPETPEMPETPAEMSTEEITEEIMPEEQVTEETEDAATEEMVSEEEVVPETPTEETLSEEQTFSEASTEETVPEEEVVSETPMEESQPFPEENPEE